MSKDTFFITTAIDYTNGAPHIGHAYEKVLADVIARYQRLAGREVFFLTGVDQHGQKVQQSAEKQGVAPQEFVDQITAKFVALWDNLDVRYDEWAATTDPRHKDCVRAILQRLWDDIDPATGASRWIYKKSEGGYYSVRQEQFLTDKERGADGEFGPEWQPVEFREEENFYFRLMPHKQWLLDLIDSRSAAGNPLVIPDFRVGELRNAVEKLEGDLCISRPVTRLQWGIPFPESFGAGFVTYVWFDALVNYISFAGFDPGSARDLRAVFGASPETLENHGGGAAQTEGFEAGRLKQHAGRVRSPEFSALWPALHVIGKDIMIPAHGVYWPIMLKALGFDGDDIPQLLVHGWWNISGAKMSKSLGNVIDPDALADKYSAEALRYYLMSDIATGKDADFSEERLIQRYNSDLANSLGNLLNRSLSMAAKYCGGEIVAPEGMRETIQALDRGETVTETVELKSPTDFMGRHAVRVNGTWKGYAEEMNRHEVWRGLGAALEISTSCNELIDQTAPWKLAKDNANEKHLDAVLYHLAESLRIIAILISPVLPKAAAGIFAQLNWDGPMTLAEATWGKLPDGHILGQPTPLFPRIEVPKA